MIEARFDDLRSSPTRASSFEGHHSTIIAHSVGDVTGAIRAAADAARAGNWVVGFISYEAAPGFDAHLSVRLPPPDGVPAPLAWFGVFDERVDAPALLEPEASFAAWHWEPSVARTDYDAQIQQIRELIRAGETYQVNHTMRLRGEFAGTDKAFYAALALAQRGGQCAYLDIGSHRILSASPELFFRLDDDGTIVTKPMKGTAPRGRWPEEDRERAKTLLATEKERAENAMIVDLLRNDLGRIAEAGTVHPTALFDVERYETVWQMTSTVEATLREGLDVADVFGALFPSGSVTGAPKVRSMQIIAELETVPRGVYCGAIGWIAPPDATGPRAEFNVAIRTVVLDVDSGQVEYGVGGGITYDSEAAREYAECLTKARVLTERRPEFRLLESIGLRENELVLLDAHMDRLADSAAYFGFALDRETAEGQIRDRAHEAASSGNSDAKIRLLLSRTGTVVASWEPIGATTGTNVPLTLMIDRTHPVDPNDVFLFHKTDLRERYTAALELARAAGADDALLVNDHGEVTEASSSNVAFEIDRQWITPHVGSGLLAGTDRAQRIASGALMEGPVAIEDARRADAMAIFNSVRGWREARLLES